MKILIWSDLQFHTWRKFGYNEDGMLKRLSDQISILDQITELTKTEKIDLGIFAGDLVEIRGNITVECMYYLQKWMNEQTVDWLFDDGNHDNKNDTVFSPHYSMYSALGVDTRPNFFRTLPENKYPIRIKTVHYYDEIDEESIKDNDLVVLHKTPLGSSQNGYTFKDGVNWKPLAINRS